MAKTRIDPAGLLALTGHRSRCWIWQHNQIALRCYLLGAADFRPSASVAGPYFDVPIVCPWSAVSNKEFTCKFAALYRKRDFYLTLQRLTALNAQYVTLRFRTSNAVRPKLNLKNHGILRVVLLPALVMSCLVGDAFAQIAPAPLPGPGAPPPPPLMACIIPPPPDAPMGAPPMTCRSERPGPRGAPCRCPGVPIPGTLDFAE